MYGRIERAALAVDVVKWAGRAWLAVCGGLYGSGVRVRDLRPGVSRPTMRFFCLVLDRACFLAGH